MSESSLPSGSGQSDLDGKINALKYALDNQIGWQKFSEAKLVILVSISGGTLSGFQQITSLIKADGPLGDIKLIVSVIFLLTCLAAFILSFLGITAFIPKSFYKKKQEFTHLIDWPYVAEKDINELLNDVDNYGKEAQIEDLVTQHKLGSEATRFKYKRFNTGAMIYASGLSLVFTLVAIQSLLA